MSWRDAFELASFVVTVIGLPFAIGVFLLQQRQERENEEEEAYQMLSDAYNDFLKIVLANADLQLRTHEPLVWIACMLILASSARMSGTSSTFTQLYWRFWRVVKWA